MEADCKDAPITHFTMMSPWRLIFLAASTKARITRKLLNLVPFTGMCIRKLQMMVINNKKCESWRAHTHVVGTCPGSVVTQRQ